MQTADFDHRVFEQGNNEGDKSLLVKFYIEPKQDEAASMEEGRPIFKEVEYVDIRVVGSRNGHVCRPARPDDKSRFPAHYKAFKERVEIPLDGTPLSEWAVITRAQAEEMAFFNVKTVEQLAAMADSVAQKFMGINSLKQKAKDWVAEAKENAPALKLAEELRVRDEENAELRSQVEELAATVAKMVALSEVEDDEEVKPKRRRSRKP